jgi:tyrosyl-tRNA synthetase
MLAKESVKARVESEHGISFTEFSYMLLQANDYWWLHQHRGCELQVGGSDQWGNITAGVDLIRRKGGAHVHALTVPLITSSDGKKFGKSAGADVWLSPERTSPYEFFQYWMSVDDEDVERWLLQLTLLPVARVATVMDEHRQAPEQRSAQRLLARELTALVHGERVALDAESASSDFTRPAGERTAEELAALVDEIPTTRLERSRLAGDLDIVELLVETGLATSKGDARRAVEQRGIYVNDAQLDGDTVLSLDALLHERFVMLRRGKKRRHLVVVEP